MAYHSGYSSKILVSNIPNNFSKSKLKLKLEQFGDRGCIEDYEQIKDNLVKITVSDIRAQRKLLNSRIFVTFGGRNHELKLENVDDDDEEDDVDTEIYTFDESESYPKPILNYLSRNQKHRKALEKMLTKHNMKLLDISGEKIEVQVQNARGFIKSEEDCGECIQRFLELYSFWNEKLENCSVADVKHIKTVLASYKEQCFGSWFNDSSTILVTGPETIVEEVQNSINGHLEKSPKKIQLPANSTAQPFNYEDVEPAIMRFVSFGKTYKHQLSVCLIGLANAEIVKKEQTLTVHVSPTQMSHARLHMDFENECRMRLVQFFRQFSVWRGKFDLNMIARQKPHQPDLFQTKNFQGCFVQWFTNTGTVNVVGVSRQVQIYRNRIESILGFSKIRSSSESEAFQPPVQIPLTFPPQQEMHVPFIHPHHSGVPVQTLHHLPVSPTSGVRQRHHSERSRRLSWGDFGDESSSSSKADSTTSVQFDTKDYKPAVLKFVFNDAGAKKDLGSCCGKFAKVSITNDQGQIKVHISFRKKHPSDVDKSRAWEQVGDYFDQFSAETNKYNVDKMESVMRDFPKLFCKEPGVFVQAFPSTGTIKYAGLKEKVEERIEDIDYEIKSEKMAETLPVDVFIAQRECGLWKKTEQKCRNKGHRVSIQPSEDGKIIYKGELIAIQLAEKTLGELTTKTIQKPVEDVTSDQLAFLKKCENSQQKSLSTKKNILDGLYRQFKKENVKGSLAFVNSDISLVAVNNIHWQKANGFLKKCIREFDISPADHQKDAPFSEVVANLKKAFRDEIVHMKSERDARNIIVFCFNFQYAQMRMDVIKTIEQMGEMNDIKKFYPMSKEIAVHVASHCKIDKAKSVKLVTESTKPGLLVTFEQEDIDTVDMEFEDLEKEIKKIEKQITGYSLYEYLSGDGKACLQITEHETKCSIVLNPIGQKNHNSLVSVKIGDIVLEKCDAIVISTGKKISFSGQVSIALNRKFGTTLMHRVLEKVSWIIQDQLCVCPTNVLLPWKYIFCIATPSDKNELTKAILDLLTVADRFCLQSLALPTIGTGNMGLDSGVVASCMKEAFSQFVAQNKVLKDIRVIVYKSSQLPVFQDVTPRQGLTKSTRIDVKIYGNSKKCLEEAYEKLQEVCDKSIKTSIIKSTQQNFYSFEKSEIQKVCDDNDVLLEWKRATLVEECHIQGLLVNVTKTEDIINKKLEAEYPQNWSSMPSNQKFIRIKLNKYLPEYLEVKQKFEESRPLYSKLIKIERVQNRFLYSQFKHLENAKKAEYSGRSMIITRQLFHGTSVDKVDKICASGFDRNFAGEHGTAYGRGMYFAVKSQYSVRYCKDIPKYMFLSEVITGDYILGNSTYKAPPEKSQSTRYDSCVDDQSSPNIFVVFPDSSVYPSYVITFQ
ncbi:uncharacterized protein LOC120327158 [Styela clava]